MVRKAAKHGEDLLALIAAVMILLYVSGHELRSTVVAGPQSWVVDVV